MKKTYVTPEVEILALTETECYCVPPKTPKEILSSTGAVIGYEEEEKKVEKSHSKKSCGWGFWGWWPFW